MTRILTWIDATGAATVLDGSSGFTLLDDPIGLEAANPSNTIDDYVSFDGGALVSRRRPVRQVALPILVQDATRVETAIGILASKLQGPGQLQYSDATQTRTLKQVIYDAGIDGSGLATPLTREVVVSLLALDPWWYGAPTVQALSTAAATPFSDAGTAFSATLPFDGGNAIGVTNAGDADAFPVVTLTGPVSTFAVTLGVAGTVGWSIATALLAGDVLVVDSRPGSRGPRLNGGAVDWSLLTESSRLFVIPSGTTSVISSATGTSGTTSASVSFEQRYLTP